MENDKKENFNPNKIKEGNTKIKEGNAKVNNAEVLQDYETIKHLPMMWKFRFYGFFKNLKFFEPYLIIMLLASGVDLFQIGLLILVQEVVTYVLEVPSGILADNWGLKRVLMLCFVFYIMSFICYFLFLGNFFALFIAYGLFGLGESFRSGTHKAMELKWMEREGYMGYKSFIYGLSRSYSLYGSTISSLISIVFVLNIPADKFIFLISILPYIADFLLIASYPSYMSEQISDGTKNHWESFKKSIVNMKVLFTDRKLGQGIISSSTFDSIFKSLKDYIQPIMKLFFAALLVAYLGQVSESDKKTYLTIALGIIYAIFYLISSFSSKNAYKLKERFSSSKRAMDALFYVLGITILLCAVFLWLDLIVAVIFLYLIIYVTHNFRRPITVDYLGDIMNKDQRATMLSVDSQLKSILVFIFAPLFGYVAEYYGIPILFLIIGIGLIILNFILEQIQSKNNESDRD